MKDILKKLAIIIAKHKVTAVAIIAAAGVTTTTVATTHVINKPGKTDDVAAISVDDGETITLEEDDSIKEKQNDKADPENNLEQDSSDSNSENNSEISESNNNNSSSDKKSSDKSSKSKKKTKKDVSKEDTKNTDDTDSQDDTKSSEDTDSKDKTKSQDETDSKDKESTGSASSSGSSSSQTDELGTVTFSVTCEPFLDDCTDSVKSKLPSNGNIMSATKVEIKDGDTVFDVLSRVVNAKGMQVVGKQSIYGAYISSLDNLSEKYYDNSTGWCYYVNGSIPSVCCDKYKVKKGDTIKWVYDSWSF